MSIFSLHSPALYFIVMQDSLHLHLMEMCSGNQNRNGKKGLKKHIIKILKWNYVWVFFFFLVFCKT